MASLSLIHISLVAGAQPQEKRRAITLEEAITIARVQSVDAAVALNELKTAYWEDVYKRQEYRSPTEVSLAISL